MFQSAARSIEENVVGPLDLPVLWLLAQDIAISPIIRVFFHSLVEWHWFELLVIDFDLPLYRVLFVAKLVRDLPDLVEVVHRHILLDLAVGA